MNAGLVSISFRELEVEAIIRLVSECGLSGIEWGGDVHVPHGDLSTAEYVGRKTREAGLAVASYGSYYRFDDCDPEAEDPGPAMEAVLDTGQALGAQAIRLWAGRHGPEETPVEQRRAIATRAREFAEAAGRRGMRIDFEFHDNTLTETPESTLHLLEETRHPNVRTLWQPPLQTSPEARLQGLRKVKPWVSNLHCNFFGQDRWPHVHLLAEGAGEWALFLEEFRSSHNDRWILIEHVKDHDPANFIRDAATLRGWLERFDGAAPGTPDFIVNA